MGFKSLMKSDKKFKIKKQHILNTDNFINKYCILDSGKKSSYLFFCPSCKSNSINIDCEDARSFNVDNINISLESIISLGGTGCICKLINCTACNIYYFVGIGYFEPNNGRDVFVLHTIIELEEV